MQFSMFRYEKSKINRLEAGKRQMEIWLRDRKQPNMTRSLSYNGPIQNLGAAMLVPDKRGEGPPEGEN